MSGWFRLGLVVLLLAGIAGVSAIVTMQFAVHRGVVAVPDLRGLPVAEAASRAAGLGLDVSVTRKLYSTVLPEGRVLLQTPVGGAEVRRGWNLAVATSLGPRRVAVPAVVGRSEREAVLLLRARGLDLGSIAHLPSARVPAGTVLAQDPEADAQGAEQPSVSLLVAEAAPPQGASFVMPDVAGKPYGEAEALLERAGFRVERRAGAPPGAQVVLTPETAPGTVLAQEPEAGARIEQGGRVVLWAAP